MHQLTLPDTFIRDTFIRDIWTILYFRCM